MKSLRIVGISIVMVVGMMFSAPGDGFGAEKFPTREIQLIIPFQPGDTDNLMRPFVEKMPEYLGQPVSLVHKPGAAGAVGAGYVASSKPDGYRLVATSESSIVFKPLTEKNLPYTWESFAPISALAEGCLILAVKSDAPWKNLKELVEYAKKNPGKINYTTSGTLGAPHILMTAFSNEAGIELTHIPSQGSGPAVTALLGGHVDMACSSITPVFPHLKAGTLRAFVVLNEKRYRTVPDIPTFTELGYKVSLSGRYGILAPKGTPKEVIETLHLSMKNVLNKHEKYIDERLKNLGSQLSFLGPEEYRDFLQNTHDYVSKVVKGMMSGK
jgi:tripartite-type tricarboxylate transporter receptor subunit TctC